MKPQQLKNLAARAAMEQIKNEKDKIQRQVTMGMMAATLITLHDKHDWDAGKLSTVMRQIFEQFDAVADKYVKIEDFYNCLEELGIKVRGEG